MNVQQRLMQRLDAIAMSVAQANGLALIGLGSSGAHRDRLDQYSDLDFFVIVRPGDKQHWLQQLHWLEQVAPVAYCFQNDPNGYKLLFADGIFCELAVFEPDELAASVSSWASEARVVWQSTDYSVPLDNASTPPAARVRTVEWLIGEALTNVLVGLGRYHRGERLAAARFIQGYAVDRLIELTALIEQPQSIQADPFALERRFEQRFPKTAEQLPRWVAGYDHSVESARTILEFLDHHFVVNPAIKHHILELCGPNLPHPTSHSNDFG